MGKFLEAEKIRYIEFKRNSSYFSSAAKQDGEYRTRIRRCCLPRSRAGENLAPEIREMILEYFARHEIKWHDAQDRRPSNHLCDSQVCGVNFLFAFADKPDALATLLRPLFPTLRSMLPIEDDLYVACEWIGAENYLRELISRNGKRTRGANCTSADMTVRFVHLDGRTQVVLIEWKYTESYYPSPLHVAKSGRKRTDIYQHLYDLKDCPLDHALVAEFGNLFYEPFYQLMRQQFLAHEMERAHELGADIVSVLHVAPRHNKDFLRVTSAALVGMGDSAIDVWKKIVRDQSRFASVYTEDLFGKFPVAEYPALKNWWEYIQARYCWIRP